MVLDKFPLTGCPTRKMVGQMPTVLAKGVGGDWLESSR